MEKLQTKALVEGAIFAGVTALLGIIYYYSQYLGIIAMVWPVPVIIVGYRNGLKASILSAMSAGLIVSLLTQPLVGLGLLIGFGLPGILMGYMINRRVNPYITIILCGMVLSLTMVGEFLLSLKAMGIDIVKFFSGIEGTVKEQLEFVINMYRQFGIAEKELQQMSDIFNKTMDMFRLLLPSSLMISGLFFSFLDYKLTRLILKRIGHVIPDMEEFSKWRLQQPYSFIMLGLMVLAVAVPYLGIYFLTAAALNASAVLTLIFTIIGVSVLFHYSRIYGDKQGIPKALRITLVILIIITFMQLIAYVGIFDSMFNLRKLRSSDY
ncbi:MAG TPA: DUF2232 domain-containing protein [Clostridia bacterium]|nr:DUF2232 domain-containing protein [Clostridia bacterium]